MNWSHSWRDWLVMAWIGWMVVGILRDKPWTKYPWRVPTPYDDSGPEGAD